MLRLTLLVIVSLFLPIAAQADYLRCDQSVISKGFTHYEVAERCGEPAFEFSRVDYRYPGYTVQVDEWTYDLGRNQFRRLLRFENGRLVHIQTRRKPRGSYLTR